MERIGQICPIDHGTTFAPLKGMLGVSYWSKIVSPFWILAVIACSDTFPSDLWADTHNDENHSTESGTLETTAPSGPVEVQQNTFNGIQYPFLDEVLKSPYQMIERWLRASGVPSRWSPNFDERVMYYLLFDAVGIERTIQNIPPDVAERNHLNEISMGLSWAQTHHGKMPNVHSKDAFELSLYDLIDRHWKEGRRSGPQVFEYEFIKEEGGRDPDFAWIIEQMKNHLDLSTSTTSPHGSHAEVSSDYRSNGAPRVGLTKPADREKIMEEAISKPREFLRSVWVDHLHRISRIELEVPRSVLAYLDQNGDFPTEGPAAAYMSKPGRGVFMVFDSLPKHFKMPSNFQKFRKLHEKGNAKYIIETLGSKQNLSFAEEALLFKANMWYRPHTTLEGYVWLKGQIPVKRPKDKARDFLSKFIVKRRGTNTFVDQLQLRHDYWKQGKFHPQECAATIRYLNDVKRYGLKGIRFPKRFE